MIFRGALFAGCLFALSATLSGCVAAVAALPVLAGGTMLARDDGSDDRGMSAAANDVPPPPFARDTPVPPTMAQPENAVTTQADHETSVGLAPMVATLRSTPTLGDPYSAFAGYAREQALRDPVHDPRKSAILATAGSLEPDRADCTIRPPAVVIDLDPGDATLDLGRPVSASEGLASHLAELRLRDIAIFWISSAAASDAGELRARLVSTGLDTQGNDGLLLMRRAEDRKQLRRRELSDTHCVVAILGDTKSDFDELFDYLKTPTFARPLDTLIGDGWFIAPYPFD